VFVLKKTLVCIIIYSVIMHLEWSLKSHASFVMLLVLCILGAFKMFDIRKSRTVTKSDMRTVLQAFYELLGKPLTDENDSPATRTANIFVVMDIVS